MSNYVSKVHKDGPDILQVETGGDIKAPGGGSLIQQTLSTYKADAGTAGSCFLVAPHAGTIIDLTAINQAASTTTKTVLTSKIGAGGTAITHPAWEIALSAAAGTKTSVTPTAANVVTAGQVIEIISDGGTDATMPVLFQVTIQR